MSGKRYVSTTIITSKNCAKKTSDTFLIVTCLEFDGHMSQILSKLFKVVPNYLLANLDNDRPLSLVDLDDK